MTRLQAAAMRAAVCSILLPGAAAAQYTVSAENGDTVQFESAALRAMLDTARALYADLEEDPRVFYLTPVGFPGSRVTVSPEDPEPSYPWNVVTVLSDSTVDARPMPANFREADRAYYNYVVQRMRVVRGTDPDVPCDSLLALEEKVVGSGGRRSRPWTSWCSPARRVCFELCWRGATTGSWGPARASGPRRIWIGSRPTRRGSARTSRCRKKNRMRRIRMRISRPIRASRARKSRWPTPTELRRVSRKWTGTDGASFPQYSDTDGRGFRAR